MDTYGVIGWPIKHSLSPAMHNAAFKELGIQNKAKYIKIPVDPDNLENFLLGNKSEKDTDGNNIHVKDLSGFNITIPHKIKAREILQKKFHIVKDSDFKSEYIYYDNISRAINTVIRKGEDLKYCNTDPIGFRHSLDADLKFKTKDKSVLIIGCGGAGRAVIAEMSYYASWVKKIYLYDINKEAVDSAKKQYSDLRNKIEFIDNPDKMLKLKNEIDLLVNTSPVGMEEGDNRLPVDKNLLRKGLYVFDLVYNRKTELFKEASALGCHVVDGRGMLAAQGAFSFSLWTGTDVPVGKIVEIMRAALNKALIDKTSMT